MNYLEKLKALMQYKRAYSTKNALLVIAFLPLYLLLYAFVATYHVVHFFYKILTSPIDYLESWKDRQAQNKQHATEAVVHFVTVPFLFLLRITASFCTAVFMLLWVPISVLINLVTLGQVKCQVFLLDTKFDEQSLVCNKPFALDKSWITAYTITCFTLLVINVAGLVLYLTGLDWNWGIETIVYYVLSYGMLVYVALITVVNPFVFIKSNTDTLTTTVSTEETAR